MSRLEVRSGSWSGGWSWAVCKLGLVFVGIRERLKILHSKEVQRVYNIFLAGGECMRKPRGKLHFLRRVLSNKSCGRIMGMFDKTFVGAPLFTHQY